MEEGCDGKEEHRSAMEREGGEGAWAMWGNLDRGGGCVFRGGNGEDGSVYRGR